jgi:Flp pilus assembly protein TadG
MRIGTRKLPGRSATAAVELAICLPLLFVLITGVWEVGRMVQTQQLVANAAREGGRQASGGLKTNTQVCQFVVDYLQMNGLTSVTLSNVTLTNLTASSRSDPSTANQLDQFHLVVTVPYSSIRWSTLAQITSTSNITASADWYAMRDLPLAVDSAIPAN